MASPFPVEQKVYMTELMRDELANESKLCGCTVTSICRTAIARELINRRIARQKANRDLPLPGQRSIDGISG